MNTELEKDLGDIKELYEHAPCGYLLTSEYGLIENVNQTFLLWTGYSRDELIRKRSFQDLLTVPGKIYYETHFATLLKMQGSVREIAFDLQRRNSPPLSVLVTTTRRQRDDRAAIQYRTTLFDATARRHYERQLLQQKRKLRLLNGEKNELLGMAAHELRTPLGVIATYAEFLEDEAGPDLTAEHREFISLIRSTSDYMLHLITDMLDLSQIEAGKLHLEPRLTDMKTLVEQIVGIHLKLAERKQIRIALHCLPALPRLMIDPLKISQVLDNLLINAIKFSPPDSQISISLKHDSRYFYLQVADQGQGIPAKDLKLIFEPFRQAQAKSSLGEPGTGLGLAIVRRIVEGHGGQISVASREHQGTEFCIHLPLIMDRTDNNYH